VTLPRCRDRDDQKFLELAYQASATALLTRDEELLRLARRTKRNGLFFILPPTSWQEMMLS
jgi:predicted nucleic acid-binding protein